MKNKGRCCQIFLNVRNKYGVKMIKDEEYDSRIPDCPRKSANWLSVLTFWYTLKTFRKGCSKEINESDLTRPLDEHKSSLLGKKIAVIWSKELAKAIKNKSKPSLPKVILKTFLKDIFIYGFVLFAMEMLIRLAQPILIGCFIRYFNVKNKNMTAPPSYPMYFNRLILFHSAHNKIQVEEAYFFGVGIFVCSFIIIMVIHPYMMAVLHVGMRMRVACCSLIYRKALRMKISAVGDNSAGNPVNLMSNDVTRFDLAPIFVHYLWIAPLQVFVVIYFMFQEAENAAIIGVTPILVIMPIQIILGVATSRIRRKVATRTDARVTQMNELIQGMQVIKMYTWEYAFAELIEKLRKKELKVLRLTSYIRGLIMSFIMFTTRFSIFLTVVTYISFGNDIDAEKVFVITAYYQILRQTMTVYFPQGVAMVGECYVSMKRIEEFMLIPESVVGDRAPLDPEYLTRPKLKILNPEVDFQRDSLIPGEKPIIAIERAIATYKNIVVLSNIELEVLPGELTIIIGPVGSGKTCLLNLILGELSILKGSLLTKGVISYASQEPWLFAGSVRQNILFGRSYDRSRYNEVVRVCALTRDFSLLPYGDRTIIGERGISLSGGQRARVNLARAVYKKADIYLLDDPLSAVDIQVGQQLFNQCIKGYLKEKVVVLATHQLQYLKEAAQIVIFHDGVIQGQGSYDSLKVSGIEFASLMSDQGPVQDEEDDPKKPVKTKSQNKIETILRHLSRSSAVSMSIIEREGVALVIFLIFSNYYQFLIYRTLILPLLIKPAPTATPEMRTFGAVECLIYHQYFRAGGHCCITLLLISMFLGAQFLASGGDYFLSKWVTLEENKFGEIKITGHFWDNLNRTTCIRIYTVIIILTIVVAITRSLFFFTMCIRSSMNLHNQMFHSVIHASMTFFNENTSGRILNRFSKDMGAVDEILPNAMIDTSQLMLNLVGAIAVVGYVEPYLLIPTVIMVFGFYFLRRIYLQTSRSVKRLEGITRSPVFAHLNATLQGLTTIRSNGAEEILVKEFDELQDVHSSAWFMFLYTSRAFGLWLDLICTVFIGIVTFTFLISEDSYYGSEVGLSITQCMGLSGLIQWGMRQSAELENQMTSVERVLEFSKIEQESDLESTLVNKPPPDWPLFGKIEFVYLNMRYRKDEAPVLKNLNFIIQPEEKIGIVGRTGAGKSSIISALFRLSYYDGLIIVDDLDIGPLGLHDLRRKISIIPQEPVLFYGTVRYNLDPFREYDDEDILKALIDVEIKFALTDGLECLDFEMAEGGVNLSVGERQMVCLARAILRNNKILVMDEATANVDPKTDKFIQETIRTKFAHCTVLTIAHRLLTVMDSDRVLVMDAGIAVEFDHPHTLLQNKYGQFYNMVSKTGPAMAKALMAEAKEHYLAKNG